LELHARRSAVERTYNALSLSKRTKRESNRRFLIGTCAAHLYRAIFVRPFEEMYTLFLSVPRNANLLEEKRKKRTSS
jgi:hypothetical protein